MKIVSSRYGKKHVRVLKVLREGARHQVKELDVSCLLEGDFEASFTASDNSKVVPTDTVKNTVIALAHTLLGRENERFGLDLVRHFIGKYPQVRRVRVEMSERRWDRHAIAGAPHDHAFIGGAGSPFACVVAERGGAEVVESGIDDLLVLKSTGSGFIGYPRDEFTTLPETTDRILSMKARMAWTFGTVPPDFNAANEVVVAAMLGVFAANYSPSVQATLHQMAAAAFAASPHVRRVTLALPNRHYLLANLKPFGLDNPNVTFIPTDEPHGQIEATIDR